MSILRDILIIGGAILVVYGCGLISASLAFIVTGVLAIVGSCWWAAASTKNDRNT